MLKNNFRGLKVYWDDWIELNVYFCELKWLGVVVDFFTLVLEWCSMDITMRSSRFIRKIDIIMVGMQLSFYGGLGLSAKGLVTIKKLQNDHQLSSESNSWNLYLKCWTTTHLLRIFQQYKTTSLESLNLINFKRLFDAHFVKGSFSCSRLAANRSHICGKNWKRSERMWKKSIKEVLFYFLI